MDAAEPTRIVERRGNFEIGRILHLKTEPEISDWTKFGVRHVKLIKQVPDPISSNLEILLRGRDFFPLWSPDLL